MSEILNEPASDNRSVIEEFLRSRGAADMAHPGGTLLEHVIRVSRRLADSGAPPEVQVAGLCHAAYGTDGFAQSLLDLADRAGLVELIGERAEALVYLYASCALLAANACYWVAQTGAVALSVAAWHTTIGVDVTPAVLMFVAAWAGWTLCWALLATCAAAGALIHVLSPASFACSVPQSTARQESPVCVSPAPTTSS